MTLDWPIVLRLEASGFNSNDICWLESQLYCHAMPPSAITLDGLPNSSAYSAVPWSAFSSDLQIYFSGKFSRRFCRIVPVASMSRHPTYWSSFTDLKKLPKAWFGSVYGSLYQTVGQVQMSHINSGCWYGSSLAPSAYVGLHACMDEVIIFQYYLHGIYAKWIYLQPTTVTAYY